MHNDAFPLPDEHPPAPPSAWLPATLPLHSCADEHRVDEIWATDVPCGQVHLAMLGEGFCPCCLRHTLDGQRHRLRCTCCGSRFRLFFGQHRTTAYFVPGPDFDEDDFDFCECDYDDDAPVTLAQFPWEDAPHEPPWP